MGFFPGRAMKQNQIILFCGLLLGIAGILSVVYFAFLRPDFAVLYEDIREADAAQIVAELDKQGIEYRLEDKGHRILVPESQVGKARVLIAGSGIAMGGTTGFELFNENDMGLTEFAQKVNYQRALQGELARTIMGMAGISFARVHLSMPERSLFQANQQGPKAAVTIQTEADGELDPGRVAGIQQLVSAAVTDLPPSRVAVLDDRGRLLSPATQDASGATSNSLTEKEALEEYYRARASGVAEKLIPGLPFQIRVLSVSLDNSEEELSSPQTADAGSDPAGPALLSGKGTSRNFALRIFFRTEAPINDDDREALKGAITQAADLVASRGDTLHFETGPLEASAGSVPASPAATGVQLDASKALGKHDRPAVLASGLFASRWLWLAFAALAVTGLIILRRRSRLSGEEQRSFAETLGENLALRERQIDAR